MPKIVLISPAYMDEHAPAFVSSMPKPGVYDAVSAQKSRELASPIRRVANETGCVFFDAAQVTQTGPDGCHITLESQHTLADKLGELLKEL